MGNRHNENKNQNSEEHFDCLHQDVTDELPPPTFSAISTAASETSSAKNSTLSTTHSSNTLPTNPSIKSWTTLASKLIYENPWLRVREDKVINPNGGEGIYGVVKFFNQAIGIIPIDEEDHTWLVGQYRYALGVYSWEIPMGGHPINEDPQVGAIRELAEETGIRAKQLEEILQVDISNSVTDEKGIVFIATQLAYGKTSFDETEDLSILRMPVEKAIDWAIHGKIRDGLSVAGLLKLAILRATTAKTTR